MKLLMAQVQDSSLLVPLLSEYTMLSVWRVFVEEPIPGVPSPSAFMRSLWERKSWMKLLGDGKGKLSKRGKDQANRLKGIITEPMTDLERKGVDSKQIESHINLIFTSNEDYLVHIERDDRRYYVIETTKDPTHDQAYFTALSLCMTGGRVAKAMYRWLMSPNLTGFNPRGFKMTGAKRAMQNRARDGFGMWMQDVCLFPYNLLDSEAALTRPQNIYPDDAYRAYSGWYEREQQGVANAKKLGKDWLCGNIHQLLGTSGKQPKDR